MVMGYCSWVETGLVVADRGSPIGFAGCGICHFFAVIFGI